MANNIDTALPLTDEAEVRALFQYLADERARAADLAVIGLLGNTADALVEYVWDHWLGEPRKPSLDQLTVKAQRFLADWRENV